MDVFGWLYSQYPQQIVLQINQMLQHNDKKQKLGVLRLFNSLMQSLTKLSIKSPSKEVAVHGQSSEPLSEGLDPLFGSLQAILYVVLNDGYNPP